MDLLDKMATFVRVVESGSLSAAARQLHVSGPAVSRQIATLEAELRLTLLTRTTRRMALTSAGRRYYERCLRVLREVDDAQAVGRDGFVEGPLQISAPVSFGLARVVPHMQTLMGRHPGLRIALTLEDRLVDLPLEGMDVAIRVGAAPPVSNEVIASRLASFQRVVVASPAYLKRRSEPKTPEALARHDALTHTQGIAADNWTLVSHDRDAHVRLSPVFRSNAPHALRELALGGAGVAMLPEWFVADDLRSRRLRVVLPAWKSVPVAVNALHRVEHRGATRVRTLIEHLRIAYAARETPSR